MSVKSDTTKYKPNQLMSAILALIKYMHWEFDKDNTLQQVIAYAPYWSVKENLILSHLFVHSIFSNHPIVQ